MKYKNICTWCGKEFESENTELNHCSLSCFNEEQDYLIKASQSEELA